MSQGVKSPAAVPPNVEPRQRAAFLAWLRYRRHVGHPGGCWGIYMHALETDAQRRAESMRRHRIARQPKLIPKGTPKNIANRFYTFTYQVGRCTFAAWWKWQQGKGPHPLQFLGSPERKQVAR